MGISVSLISCSGGERGPSEQGGADAQGGAVGGAGSMGAVDGPSLENLEIGGDFMLTADTGDEFRLQDHRGRVVLLFFGYTSCPDVCPVTMSKIAQAHRLLEEVDEEPLTLFVTVDIARDTPEALAEYLGYFGLESIGLTGSREQIDAVVAQYGAAYEIEDSGSAMGPLVAHSTYLYLIGRNGNVRALLRHEDTPEWIAAGLRKALAEEPDDAAGAETH